MSNTFDLGGMYQWAIQECNRTDVAYSQIYRNQMTVDGITYYDCSSFVFFACWLGGSMDIGALGFPTDINKYHNREANAWTVNGMIRYLRLYGGFQEYAPASTTWFPGDILAKSNAHTEILYQPPKYTMGAHNTNDGVTIRTQPDPNTYNILFRWADSPGPHPPGPTLPMPIWLIKRAINNQGGGLFG